MNSVWADNVRDETSCLLIPIPVLDTKRRTAAAPNIKRRGKPYQPVSVPSPPWLAREGLAGEHNTKAFTITM